MKIVNKNIDSLIFAEYNPRQLTDEQYQQLKDSITRFGLVDPIIVNEHIDRKNIIVGGHQRAKVAKKLNIEEVPCVFVNLPYEKERELNVRLNKNTGGWDYDILADMFDLDELIDWGFKEEELVGFDAEIEVEGKIDDDEIPEDVEPVCKLGDIWELGNHRLLCGDVLKSINKLPSDYDAVITDPPYGMSAVQSSGVLKDKYKEVLNDENNIVAIESFELLKTNKPSVWFGANYYSYTLPSQSCWLVWDKNNGASDQMDCELAWTNLKGVTRQFTQASEKKNRVHPTQKPIELIVWVLEKVNEKIILDPFLGSGSTLIACEKTNRVCYGMELDPHYCDVIINRWEQYTGKEAKLLNGST
tara:strand:+ start:3002 stop:4078 length:1077 start_codon:yes stop_codon:yes gene_type:complete